MEEVINYFSCWCDLHTRQIETGIQLPERLNPAPHLEIFDLKLFTTTALTRLFCESPRLRAIAERNLRAVIKCL